MICSCRDRGRGEELVDARQRFLVPGQSADDGVHYTVRYRDAKGHEHSAECFIAAPSGTIHLSDDERVA